jgi:hypothetical protein
MKLPLATAFNSIAPHAPLPSAAQVHLWRWLPVPSHIVNIFTLFVLELLVQHRAISCRMEGRGQRNSCEADVWIDVFPVGTAGRIQQIAILKSKLKLF